MNTSEPSIQHCFDQFNKLGKSCQKASRKTLLKPGHTKTWWQKKFYELYSWKKKDKLHQKMYSSKHKYMKNNVRISFILN